MVREGRERNGENVWKEYTREGRGEVRRLLRNEGRGETFYLVAAKERRGGGMKKV